MARMTIAQLREREVDRLARYHSENYTGEDRREACRLMNSFYRLCGLAETNLYLSNDVYYCNSAYTKLSEERERKWFERLKKQFEDFSGLTLFYAGYAPSIGIVNPETGACAERIGRWFYD